MGEWKWSVTDWSDMTCYMPIVLPYADNGSNFIENYSIEMINSRPPTMVIPSNDSFLATSARKSRSSTIPQVITDEFVVPGKGIWYSILILKLYMDRLFHRSYAVCISRATRIDTVWRYVEQKQWYSVLFTDEYSLMTWSKTSLGGYTDLRDTLTTTNRSSHCLPCQDHYMNFNDNKLGYNMHGSRLQLKYLAIHLTSQKRSAKPELQS